jgi:hypothetical protein
MREREEIERELEQRREDLAQNLGQLKEVMRDRVEDVKRPLLTAVAVAASVVVAGGLIMLRARSVRLRPLRRRRS